MSVAIQNNRGTGTFLHLPRVILFDDEPQFLTYFSEFMRRKRMIVDAFSDSEEAREAIFNSTYDGGIFDINDANLCPVGLDLAQMFRERFSVTPCFCITGYPDFEYKVREVGATYFEKPIRPEKEGREVYIEIWSHYLAVWLNSPLPPYAAIVEHIHDGNLTVCFRDSTLGWMLVELKSPQSLLLSPGDMVLIGEVYNDKGEMLGFRIVPQPSGPRQEDDGPQSPKDFNDREQFERYMAELKKFLGEKE